MGIFGSNQNSLYERGRENYFKKNYEKAIQYLTKAADVKKYGETARTASCFELLGDAKRRIDSDGAVQAFSEAVRIYNRIGQPYPALLAEIKLAGIYFYWKKDPASAARHLKLGLAYEPRARGMMAEICLAENKPLQEAVNYIYVDMICKKPASDDALSALEDVTAEELCEVGAWYQARGEKAPAYACFSYVKYWEEEEADAKAQKAIAELEADEAFMAQIKEMRAKYDEFLPEFKQE